LCGGTITNLTAFVACDFCEVWYHRKCVDCDTLEAADRWYCPRCTNELDKKDPLKSQSIQQVLSKLLPSHIPKQSIREVLDLLTWVGLDLSGTRAELRDRLAGHLKELKRMKSSRHAPSGAPSAPSAALSAAPSVAPPVAEAKERKKKTKKRVITFVSRLSKSNIDEIGRQARLSDVGSIHQEIYLQLMDPVRSSNPDVLDLIVHLTQCELSTMITGQIWETLIDIFLHHSDRGAAAWEMFTVDVNLMVRQTCLWEVLFKQLPHPFPPAFVTFFCPLMVHTTINYFLRFCQQNGMPLSNAAEPVDDDIVYSPDDEAVLVGWVLHSIISVMYSRRRRGDKQKLCEG